MIEMTELAGGLDVGIQDKEGISSALWADGGCWYLLVSQWRWKVGGPDCVQVNRKSPRECEGWRLLEPPPESFQNVHFKLNMLKLKYVANF